MPSVVVVGSASRDLHDDDPRGWRLGGGVAYGALTLARLGLRTGAVIGLDTEAMHASELDLLRAAGVSIVRVPLVHGPVFVNDETPFGRVQKAVDRSDPIPPAALPEAWGMSLGWLFAPVADELPEDWALMPGAGATVALGWQGFLRVLRPGEPVRRRQPRPSALLARSSLVGVSIDDLPRDYPLAMLETLLMGPAAELLLTAADRGGVLFRIPAGRVRALRYPAITAERTVDPTGAGDVALACMLAGRIAQHATGTGHGWAGLRCRHLRLAAAAASLVVEQPGLAGVLTYAAIRRRLSASDSESQPT